MRFSRTPFRAPLVVVAFAWLGYAMIADGATVAVIEIRSEITKGLERYIDRALADAEAQADAIVFDMNTPGGRVDVMGDVINHIFETNLPTIAYVHNEAISAGAMIALSTDQIVMAPGGTIGDAAPVTSGGEELGEKAVSYIRGKIRATAERNGRNPDIGEAMVDKKKTLVRVGDSVQALTKAEFETLRESDDTYDVISPEGELLTLTTNEATDLEFVEFTADTLDDLLAAYSLVEIDGRPAALTDAQIAARRASAETGSALRVVESLADARVVTLKRSVTEKLAMGITGSMLGSILLSIGMMGLLIEFRTPGFGVPGALGLLCIAAFFGGHVVADVDASVGLIMFLIGLGLLALEAFVIPGFGIAGISGLALTFGGLFFTFATNAPTLTDAFASFSLAILLSGALVIVVGMALPKTRAWNSLVLSTEQHSAVGYRAPRAELAGLVGHAGVALTPLRPAGTAEIDGERVDVVADGEYIAKGESLSVSQVEGGRVVVRPVRRSDGAEVEKETHG